MYLFIMKNGKVGVQCARAGGGMDKRCRRNHKMDDLSSN